ncbi:MAG: glutamate--tRNA ligase [bacterium]
MTAIRVRFAPSPTGYLHIGGARTALFNWLFARRMKGTFILRIEDTDLERSSAVSVQAILESMTWLGLDWDEGPGKEGKYGPYFQTQRFSTYRQYCEKLLANDLAYPCYCTPEELAARREEAQSAGLPPRYDGRCRHLTPEQRTAYAAAGRQPAIRFKVGEGSTVVDDIVRGSMEFNNATLEDFVIMKSDGVPTYNFAVVIDDALMEITHVIRGDDHISNTPRQILIYRALGFDLPLFAHIPMILGPDHSRLSKRHGATSVTQYRDEGYLPEALVNYLALLGWSYDGTQTVFSREELIEKFALDKVSKNPAVFDQAKLVWLNGLYIKEAAGDRLCELALPFLQAAGLAGEKPSPAEKEYIAQVVAAVRDRVKLVSQIAEFADYFFKEDFAVTEEGFHKYLSQDYVPAALAGLAERLAALTDFSEAATERVLRGYSDEIGRKAAALIHPLRVALTGRVVSPSIFTVVCLLGRERVLQRIQRTLRLIEEKTTADD